MVLSRSSSRTQLKLIGGVDYHHLWHIWRERCAYKERAKRALAGVVGVAKYISGILSCLTNHVNMNMLNWMTKQETKVPLMKNPFVWSLWSFLARSAQSPPKIVLHPSNNETCRLKSCRILINAGLRPGISSPFLMRRISRIGSMPAPTFSSNPRIKARRVSTTPPQT